MCGGSGVLIRYVVRERNKLNPNTLMDDPVASYQTHGEEIVKRAMIIAAGNKKGTEKDGLFEYYFIADKGKV